MSRTRKRAVPPDFLIVQAPCEVTLRTLLRPTKLGGRLLRVIAYYHGSPPPQLLQAPSLSVNISRIGAVSSVG